MFNFHRLIRGNDWKVDAKVFSVAASVNLASFVYMPEDIEKVAACTPDPEYLKDNPIRATLFHKDTEKSRLTRLPLSVWFTDNERKVGGVEVRHCVWWNEKYGPAGAWDPTGCTLKETNSNSTICECENFGLISIISERTEPIEVNDDCEAMEIMKIVGIAFSILTLLTYCLVTIGSKYVWDMFHVVRMHVAITWMFAIVLHLLTDADAIRDDAEMNLLIGFLMKYFYTSAITWTVCDAHAHFKAFTSGIISGRTGIYLPFGYGTPLLPLGILFLFFHDDLGVDPRCFVGWNWDAKNIYLIYNLLVCLLAVIFAIIIIFNLKKPQTRRRNVVADLTSQANGIVAACFFQMGLWVFAQITYTHNPESDSTDPYCYFILFLGWFGVILFLLLGVGSKKFRNGVKGEKSAKEGLMASLAAKQADQALEEDEEDPVTESSSVLSHPAVIAPVPDIPEDVPEEPKEESSEEEEEEKKTSSEESSGSDSD